MYVWRQGLAIHILQEWRVLSAIKWLLTFQRGLHHSRDAHLLQRDPEEPNGSTPIPTTASLHSSVFLDRKRGSGWSNGREIGSWWLCRLSTAMNSAPGLHYEICGRSCHHQGLYSGECVSCSNPEYPGEKIHLQGLDADKGCLLCLSSPERWVHNGWKKWRWTCFKFSGSDSESYNSFGWLFLKDNGKMQVISVFAKGMVQWSRWDFMHLQKQGPRAEL